jgi:hypothetical protein
MRKGDRVHVLFRDISASLHDCDNLPTAKGELCGWVLNAKGKDVQFEYCRYIGKGHSEKDRITIPKGCIDKVEVI